VLFHIAITEWNSVPTGAGGDKEAHRFKWTSEKWLTHTASRSYQAQRSECKRQTRKLLYNSLSEGEKIQQGQDNFKYIPLFSGLFPILLSPESAGDRILRHNNLWSTLVG